ncbi:hypothetical protein L2E82_26936 [Cichorium intybus]|uniref:Uncharacterized protein n=1 Tax=Cichorium intybus TaxID=13427 RepID=A0ACB9CS85_CICIN|nr:hypothetical protein L2E82_26936 [Cichorium intybus]
MLFLIRSIPSALSKSDSSIVDVNIAISDNDSKRIKFSLSTNSYPGVANEFGTIWHVQYHSTVYDDPLAEVGDLLVHFIKIFLN